MTEVYRLDALLRDFPPFRDRKLIKLFARLQNPHWNIANVRTVEALADRLIRVEYEGDHSPDLPMIRALGFEDFKSLYDYLMGICTTYRRLETEKLPEGDLRPLATENISMSNARGVRSVMKLHGAKFNIAPWIISHFPENFTTFVEPYAGSLAVLLAKSPSSIEIANDLDPAIMNLWTTLRDRCADLQAIIDPVEYTAEQFAYSRDRLDKPRGKSDAHHTHWAAHALICNRLSRGGMFKEFAVPGKGDSRLRGGLPDNINAWATIKPLLPSISERIRNVIFSNKPAMDLVFVYRDDPDAVIYLDPVYLPSVRTAQDCYRFEMNARDHMHLLDAVRMSKATIFLSGYASKLYDAYLAGWHFVSRDLANSSGQNDAKQSRTEILWSNKPFRSLIP